MPGDGGHRKTVLTVALALLPVARSLLPSISHAVVRSAPLCAWSTGVPGVPTRGSRCRRPRVALCSVACARHTGAHSVLAMPYDDLCGLLGERDARSAWNLYRSGRDAADDAAPGAGDGTSRKFTVSAAGRAMLASLEALVRVEDVSVSADGTTKLLLRLADGLAVETVLIPPLPQKHATARSSRAKTSLCLSSQVGCMRGCRFCSTGAMGIVRNLAAEEILATVILSRQEAAARHLPSVDNIVFMGMGEPMDNGDAVTTAVNALTDQRRFAFAKAKVLISTVGPSPEALRALADVDVPIAWSVHR